MNAGSLLDPANPTFDYVVVTEGGERKRYSFSDFMRMPLAARIRLIIGADPRFCRGGEEIPKATALALHAA